MKKVLFSIFLLIPIFLYSNENNDDISNIINNSLSNYFPDNDSEIIDIINTTLGDNIKVDTEKQEKLSQLNENREYEELEKFEKEELNIDDPDEIYNLARIYAKGGYFESAYRVSSLDKTNNVKNLYISATAARMIGEYDVAISNYKQVLRINENHIKSILGLGLAYRSKGDYQRALTYLIEFNNVFPSPAVTELINELKSK